MTRDYRMTRQVNRGVRDLASNLGLDVQDFPTPGRREGPAPRVVETRMGEPDAAYGDLIDVLRSICRERRMPLGMAAVLTPRKRLEDEVLFELNERGIPAEPGRDGEAGLDHPAVKVLTLQSAKGLEFPIVVAFGIDEGVLPREVEGVPDEERPEHRQRDARTLFVACSRGMRALVVMHGQEAPSPFLEGLSWGK
ncbi:MAG: 3'-5' exonuclease [Trueperaceae bacterium]|nr:3'-5' exonuclease [Trueperaceae bacterium]